MAVSNAAHCKQSSSSSVFVHSTARNYLWVAHSLDASIAVPFYMSRFEPLLSNFSIAFALCARNIHLFALSSMFQQFFNKDLLSFGSSLQCSVYTTGFFTSILTLNFCIYTLLLCCCWQKKNPFRKMLFTGFFPCCSGKMKEKSVFVKYALPSGKHYLLFVCIHFDFILFRENGSRTKSKCEQRDAFPIWIFHNEFHYACWEHKHSNMDVMLQLRCIYCSLLITIKESSNCGCWMAASTSWKTLEAHAVRQTRLPFESHLQKWLCVHLKIAFNILKAHPTVFQLATNR